MSHQNMSYHVKDAAFLAVLSDPVVCYAQARFKQMQVESLSSYLLHSLFHTYTHSVSMKRIVINSPE